MSQMPKGKFLDIANEIASQYSLFNVIFVDKGSFKETYRAESPNGDFYAVKVLDPKKCSSCRPKREIEAAIKCNSPHIAKLLQYGSVLFRGINYLFTIEEFFLGGTLQNKCLKCQITPDIARKYAKILTEAISYLKDMELVHRDIKPANIMFRDAQDSPILVDFGIVRDLTKASATLTWLPRGPCTPFFAAPEQLNNEKNLIGWRTDQFGIGVTLAYCLTGKHPYQKLKMKADQAIDEVGKKGSYSDEFRDYANKNGLTFILKMIEAWPIRRFSTIEALISAIQ
jgi:serine/threonine protein kinase